MRLFIYVLAIAVTLYSLFDCARTPQEQVRKLPKWAWIVLIIIFELLGSLLWLFVGRPKRTPGNTNRGPRRPIAPDDDPDFLRGL